MFSHHRQPPRLNDDPLHAEVEQWARLEGKSDSMAADLVRNSNAGRRQQEIVQAWFCPHCFSCGACGAIIVIAVERVLFAS